MLTLEKSRQQTHQNILAQNILPSFVDAIHKFMEDYIGPRSTEIFGRKRQGIGLNIFQNFKARYMGHTSIAQPCEGGSFLKKTAATRN